VEHEIKHPAGGQVVDAADVVVVAANGSSMAKVRAQHRKGQRSNHDHL